MSPYLKKQKPKPCKTLINEITLKKWPGDIASQLDELSRLIHKYKFKEALPILEALIGLPSV